MGRRAKPVEIYVLKNERKKSKREIQARREAEASLRPPADAIKPPSWLDKAAKREWRRIVKTLEGLNILTNADVDLLAQYCDALARYAEAAKLIQEQGVVIETERGPQQNPAVLVLKKYSEILQKCAIQLGLTPSARASLALKRKDEQPKDEFEELFG